MSVMPRLTQSAINAVPLHPLLSLNSASSTSSLSINTRESSLRRLIGSSLSYEPQLMDQTFIRQNLFTIPNISQYVRQRILHVSELYGSQREAALARAESSIQNLIATLIGGICREVSSNAQDEDVRIRSWLVPASGGVNGSRSDIQLLIPNDDTGEVITLVTGEVKKHVSFTDEEMEMLVEAVRLSLVTVQVDAFGSPEVEVSWAGMPPEFPATHPTSGRDHKDRIEKILEQVSHSIL